jgi:release factor glutamine methyltransferase
MASDTWSTQRLLQWTTRHFEKHSIDAPRVSAEMLLGHVLGVPRLKLYMDPHRPASQLERAAFRELVERAIAHEPVDYLVGKAPFFSMTLHVSPDVLIPRPSTEALVEHVLQHARRTPGFDAPRVADVGTGSGAIAVAIAKHLPGSHIDAVDLSDAALTVANRNAAEQGVQDRIEFHHGDLLEPLVGRRLDYLLSNPPYISDAEWRDVPPNVKDHEPELALRGGTDGLDLIRRLVAAAPELLRSDGQLVLEIAASQKAAVIELVRSTPGLHEPIVLPDHERLPRVLVAEAD